MSEGKSLIQESAAAENFKKIGLTGAAVQGAVSAGYETPSPIQTMAVPVVLKGRDLIGQARTGSGKTAAFALPAMEKMLFNKTVEVLVLVPTRELSEQVVNEFLRLGKHSGVKVVSVVGGQSSFRQIETINRGAQVVVATPGRLLDHLSSKKLKNFSPRLVVLDEADEMLDMGFIDDIKKILTFIPSQRQTLLFSATMPPAIVRLANEALKDPEHIQLNQPNEKHTDIEQILYVVEDREKELALVRLLAVERPAKAIVFCRTKVETEALSQNLIQAGIKARSLHGDLSQGERTRAITEIKEGEINVLVATDVASRGLDISDLSHVFNYHTPEGRERYTHRIGRTGRAGNKGKAITLATPLEVRRNLFYTRKPTINFTYGTVPSKKQMQQIQSERLVQSILGLPVSDASEALCQQLLSQVDVETLLKKLVGQLMQKAVVSGPEYLGFTSEDVTNIFSRNSYSNSSQSQSRGGGRSYSSPRSSGGGGRSNSSNYGNSGGRRDDRNEDGRRRYGNDRPDANSTRSRSPERGSRPEFRSNGRPQEEAGAKPRAAAASGRKRYVAAP
ncbi:MAG: DEAD/DEAH box helicase [Oligoflexales bacterium]|nr:DEAD/DEAH box helicase [Oligoflexales bacterium]